MSLKLVKLPFRVVGFLFSLVFVGGMVEFFGMVLYLQWRDQAALQALTAGGVTPRKPSRSFSLPRQSRGRGASGCPLGRLRGDG
ncbi:hypothetical protein ACFQL1_23015 [Halomicroarcula sp. GCM10025709]|uniref:hypothetical protein n=1 Tax=Halomicroarcula sp. GCM10025709 TaxID=3252669 RepID=UPI003620A8EF